MLRLDENYTGPEGKDREQKSAYRLNPGSDPKQIDFQVEGKPDTPGIYKFENGQLVICMNELGSVADGRRPTEFGCESGEPPNYLLVLERENAEKGAASQGNARQNNRAGAAERKRLMGSWEITEAYESGRRAPPKQVMGSRLIVLEDRILVRENKDADLLVFSYKLMPEPDPKQIDLLIVPSRGSPRTLPAIYKLADERLRICFNWGNKRPERFVSEKRADDFDSVLLVMKRHEPGETDEASAAERKKLEGKWKVVRAAGKNVNVKDDLVESFSKNGRVPITGSTLTIHVSSEKASEAVYLLGPSKTPKQIDLFDKGDGRPMQGIYKLEDERLTICFNPKERQPVRPRSFSTDQDEPDRLLLLELERRRPQPTGKPKDMGQSTDGG